MKHCKKCNSEFEPKKGLQNYCSLKCRSGRVWTDVDKLKKSMAAKKSDKVRFANKNNFFRTKSPGRSKLPRITTLCLYCNEPIVHKSTSIRKYHAHCWLLSSGGYRENSTRITKCIYNNTVFDSKAELRFAILLDNNKIKWIKNTTTYFEYYDESNKLHKYYPDFYLSDFDLWIEIKGKYYEDKDLLSRFKYKCIQNYEVIYSNNIRLPIGVLGHVEWN